MEGPKLICFEKYQVWMGAVRGTVSPDSLVQFGGGGAGSTFCTFSGDLLVSVRLFPHWFGSLRWWSLSLAANIEVFAVKGRLRNRLYQARFPLEIVKFKAQNRLPKFHV